MTDDKVLDTATDAYLRTPGWDRDAMRAALAAADKVRAEGFDFEAKYTEWATEGTSSTRRIMRDCFAAGLAKGEVERAALVEALETIRQQYVLFVGPHDSIAVATLGVVNAALALVRKGV